jgi:hypothetical protein
MVELMPFRRRACSLALLSTFALVAGLGACGGSSRSSTPASTVPVRALEAAGPEPSASTRMVCGAEGKEEIASTVGVDVTRPLMPTWIDHLYSCDYFYANGRATLSVKELSTAGETTAYFDALGKRLGRGHALFGLGQGAYQTTNGSTVVRKDYRVLLVDVSQLASHFGKPSSPRADVSLSVAATIMGCWTGA